MINTKISTFILNKYWNWITMLFGKEEKNITFLLNNDNILVKKEDQI